MDIQQIKKWRKSLNFPPRDYQKIDEQDLDVVDFLIKELEKSYKHQQKDKCSNCSFWKKSSETGFGFCQIGKDYFVGNNKCQYGAWKPKDEGEWL